jgi:hypothetical protein
MANLPDPIFDDIQAILNWLVNGKTKNLQRYHGPTFGWANRAQLLAAKVQLKDKEYRLIAPELTGNGQGAKTFLVQALTTGVDGWVMPYKGNDESKYATAFQVATIVAWIDAGCPPA